MNKNDVCILIFAGTTEGRELSAWLNRRQIFHHVSVATEYGSVLLEKSPYSDVLQGRLDKSAIRAVVNELGVTHIIDATHPYALIVSSEIKMAIAGTNVEYLRLLRNTGAELEGMFKAKDLEQAIEFINSIKGNVFVTTGVKELPLITNLIDDKKRIVARVLPSVESIRTCNELGIECSHIIALQGPFSKESNIAQFKQAGVSVVLTKQTGSNGGFLEKVSAAKELGLKLVVITNPETSSSEELNVYSAAQIKEIVSNLFGLSTESKRKLILAGAGTGDESSLTQEVFTALQTADIVFGSPRILSRLNGYFVKKEFYEYSKVMNFLNEHPCYDHPLVLFSGDVGFFSGANAYVKNQDCPWEVELLPGISSVLEFSAKLKKPLNEWHLLSNHGRKVNLLAEILRFNKLCILLGKLDSVKKMLAGFIQLQDSEFFSRIEITLGCNLGLASENIIGGTPLQLLDSQLPEGLYILLAEYSLNPLFSVRTSFPDDFFIRGTVPMTKRAVRSIVLDSLKRLCILGYRRRNWFSYRRSGPAGI